MRLPASRLGTLTCTDVSLADRKRGRGDGGLERGLLGRIVSYDLAVVQDAPHPVSVAMMA